MENGPKIHLKPGVLASSKIPSRILGTHASLTNCATWSGSMSIRQLTPLFCLSTKRAKSRRLDRTQPGLPLKKGRAGTMTHDYKRHGTTTLFAALNVLDGTVIGRNMQRHRHQEFIRFLNAIEKRAPAGKTIQAIVDNYATINSRRSANSLPAIPAGPFTSRPLRHLGSTPSKFFRDPDKAAIETRRVPIDRRSPSRDQPLP